MVRPNFLSEGVISRIIFRYMHKDQFLCIFSQIKNNAYLPVHLVHAPSFWWSTSYSFTFSFLCVFFQFLCVVRYFCLRFLCFVFVSRLSNLSMLNSYLMKVIPETRTKFDIYVLFRVLDIVLTVVFTLEFTGT